MKSLGRLQDSSGGGSAILAGLSVEVLGRVMEEEWAQNNRIDGLPQLLSELRPSGSIHLPQDHSRQMGVSVMVQPSEGTHSEIGFIRPKKSSAPPDSAAGQSSK